MPTPPPPVIIVPHPGSAAFFFGLLQRGFLLPCRRPVTIADLLRNLPGLDRAYLERSVQTIFVNATAVDTVGQVLHPGDTLALSAPMPGLAGAIFRRGGRHGCLRSTARPAPPADPDSRFVTVKLFNRIAADRGGAILARGILVRGSILARFLESRDRRARAWTREIRVHGRHQDYPDLAALAGRAVLLHLTLADAGA